MQTPLTLKRVLSGRMKPIEQLTAREKVQAKESKDFVKNQKGASCDARRGLPHGEGWNDVERCRVPPIITGTNGRK